MLGDETITPLFKWCVMRSIKRARALFPRFREELENSVISHFAIFPRQSQLAVRDLCKFKIWSQSTTSHLSARTRSFHRPTDQPLSARRSMRFRARLSKKLGRAQNFPDFRAITRLETLATHNFIRKALKVTDQRPTLSRFAIANVLICRGGI